MNKNIFTFLGCDGEYSESDIVIFGAPYDSTTSYRPGTRFASSAMRNESYGLETYSPYLDRDLTDMQIFDGGDLELVFGDNIKTLSIIEAFTKKIIDDKKIPLMIGGEHLVTLGAVRAMASKYKDLCIVHFDAHADLRDDYLTNKLSHATVMRRCHEILEKNSLFQFGIRSGDREEFIFSENNTDMTKFNFSGVEKLREKINNRPVYFSIDLDVLDPSIFPGTGTPEAGGVTFLELLAAIKEVCENQKIVGADICELAPNMDTSGASTAVALKIMRELTLQMQK